MLWLMAKIAQESATHTPSMAIITRMSTFVSGLPRIGRLRAMSRPTMVMYIENVPCPTPKASATTA